MGPFSAYIHKNHILSNIDARVKILSALAVLIMALSYRGFLFPAVTTMLCLVLIFRMRIPVRLLLSRFGESLFIAAVVVLLKLFFSGKDTLFSVNIFGAHITGYNDGLMEGLFIANRIISAVSIVAVLCFSTPFTEIMAGLSWFRVPKGLIEIMMFAYRYIFVLFEDAQVIYLAQKNRLGYSSLRRGLSSFGALTGALTIRAFDNSQSTSIAMVQRGYDGAMPGTSHRSFRSSEVVASALFVMVMGVIWRI